MGKISIEYYQKSYESNPNNMYGIFLGNDATRCNNSGTEIKNSQAI